MGLWLEKTRATQGKKPATRSEDVALLMQDVPKQNNKADLRSRTVARNRALADQDAEYSPAGVSRSVWDALRAGTYRSAVDKKEENTQQARKSKSVMEAVMDGSYTDRRMKAGRKTDWLPSAKQDLRARTVAMNRQRHANNPDYAPASMTAQNYHAASTTSEDIEKNWKRWVALAGLNRTPTDAERKEMKTASKALYGDFGERMRISFYGTNEERARLRRYDMLRTILDNKSSGISAFQAGFADSIPGVGWGYRKIQDLTRPAANDPEYIAQFGEGLTKVIAGNDALDDAARADTAANVGGRIVGGALSLNASGATAGKAVEGAKWFQKLAKPVQGAVKSGVVFGTERGLQALDDVQTKEQWERSEERNAQEAATRGQAYEKQPYSAWQQAGGVLREAGIGAVGGAAGSALGGIVGNQAKRFLVKKQLQTPFAEVMRNALEGTAFAAGDIGATYFLYPEGSRPTKEQVAQDLALGFLFSTVTSSLDARRTTQANKAILDRGVAEMKAKYQATLDPNLSNAQKAAAIDEIRAYNSNIRKAIASNYYAGQQAYLDDILLGLDAIDEQLSINMRNYGGNSGKAEQGRVPVATPAVQNMEVMQGGNSADFANRMDLIRANSTDVGSASTAPESLSKPNNTLAASEQNVKATANEPQAETAGHTPQMQKVIEEYQAAADPNIAAFAQYAISNPGDNKTAIQLGDVPQRQAAEIEALTGISVEGFGTEAKANAFRHIAERHGANGVSDRSMADINDVARMQYVIDNYDGMELLPEDSREFRDRNSQRAPLIRLSKRVNGNYYIVEAVPDTKRKKLEVVTAYKEAAHQGRDAQGPRSNVRNAADATAPNPTIPQATEEVKAESMDDAAPKVQKDQYASSKERWIAQANTHADESAIPNLSDIVSYIEKKFGIPISTGNVGARDALGIYKGKPETIRTQVSNALPTIAHELGHHLDKTYHLKDIISLHEVIEDMETKLSGLYKKHEIPGEAVAEFIRIYLSDQNRAKSKYPNFYEAFRNQLDKKALSVLDSAAKQINQYFSSGLEERAKAAIVTKKESNKRDWSNIADKLYQEWIDSNYPIKQMTSVAEKLSGKTFQAADNAYKLATNSLNAESRANFIITESMTDSHGNYGLGPSLIEALSDVDVKNQKDFSAYLVNRHAMDWLTPDENGKTKRVFADDMLNNLEEVKRLAYEAEQKHPEFEGAAQKVYQYQRDLLKYWLVDTGLMSQETYQKLLEKYPNYVPFQRAVQNGTGAGGVKRGFANIKAPIRRAKGSGLEIIDPIESIVQNTSRIVKAAMRNEVMQKISDYADNIEGLGYMLERVPPDMVGRSVDTGSINKKVLDVLQENMVDADIVEQVLEQAIGDSITGFTPVADIQKGIVTVYRGGKPQYYQVHNKQLLESLAGLSPEQLTGIYKISQSIMLPMKALTTGMNPFFSIGSNIWRDLKTAYANGDGVDPVSFLGQYFTAYIDMIRNSEDYKQYRAMGGGNNSALAAERNLIKKVMREVQQRDAGKAQRAFSRILHPISTIQDLGDAIETSNRLAEFKRVKKKGRDNQEAIYQADDITTNFKRFGTKGRRYNALFMFGNAQLQGMDRMARNFSQSGSKAFKTAMKLIVPALLTTAFLKWWNREDEEAFQNLSAYHKNNYYNFSIGDGRFIRIPKARETDLLTSTIERAFEQIFQGDSDAFYQFSDYLLEQIIPPGIPTDFNNLAQELFGDTVAGPLVDVAANRDFKGSPIVPGSMSDIAPKMQYDERTSLLAVWIGQLFDMSPKQIDHIINSSTGVLGRINKSIAPSSIYKDGTWSSDGVDFTLGLKNQFIVDSVYSTDAVNKFYEEYEETKRQAQYHPDDSEALYTFASYENEKKYISQFQKAINNSGFSQAGKRTARNTLNGEVKDFRIPDDEIDRKLKQLCAAYGDTDILIKPMDSKLEKTVDKKKYLLQLTPEEYRTMQKEAEQLIRSEYKNILSGPANKNQIQRLKDAQSKAKSRIKEKYKKQYALQFREAGK